MVDGEDRDKEALPVRLLVLTIFKENLFELGVTLVILFFTRRGFFFKAVSGHVR